MPFCCETAQQHLLQNVSGPEHREYYAASYKTVCSSARYIDLETLNRRNNIKASTVTHVARKLH
jgi:hypothetical protein